MSADWHIGQKVVCVDASRTSGRPLNEGGLCLGKVYTIREIKLPPEYNGVGFLLEEIINPKQEYTSPIGVCIKEASYRVARFRPVVEDKTQFGLLTSILDRVSKREKVGT